MEAPPKYTSDDADAGSDNKDFQLDTGYNDDDQPMHSHGQSYKEVDEDNEAEEEEEEGEGEKDKEDNEAEEQSLQIAPLKHSSSTSEENSPQNPLESTEQQDPIAQAEEKPDEGFSSNGKPSESPQNQNESNEDLEKHKKSEVKNTSPEEPDYNLSAEDQKDSPQEHKDNSQAPHSLETDKNGKTTPTNDVKGTTLEEIKQDKTSSVIIKKSFKIDNSNYYLIQDPGCVYSFDDLSIVINISSNNEKKEELEKFIEKYVAIGEACSFDMVNEKIKALQSPTDQEKLNDIKITISNIEYTDVTVSKIDNNQLTKLDNIDENKTIIQKEFENVKKSLDFNNFKVYTHGTDNTNNTGTSSKDNTNKTKQNNNYVIFVIGLISLVVLGVMFAMAFDGNGSNIQNKAKSSTVNTNNNLQTSQYSR